MRIFFLFFAILLGLPTFVFAQNGLPNTFNSDQTINLPDRAEDVTDIEPLADTIGFGLGTQIVTGIFAIPMKYQDYITFNEVGFNKSSYRPFAYSIKKEDILSKARTEIDAGKTIYFFYGSSHPLHIKSADGKLLDLDSGVIATRVPEMPAYSYTFTKPGTYEYFNALRPYQRGEVVVRGTELEIGSVSIIPSTTFATVAWSTNKGSWGQFELETPKQMSYGPFEWNTPRMVYVTDLIPAKTYSFTITEADRVGDKKVFKGTFITQAVTQAPSSSSKSEQNTKPVMVKKIPPVQTKPGVKVLPRKSSQVKNKVSVKVLKEKKQPIKKQSAKKQPIKKKKKVQKK